MKRDQRRRGKMYFQVIFASTSRQVPLHSSRRATCSRCGRGASPGFPGHPSSRKNTKAGLGAELSQRQDCAAGLRVPLPPARRELVPGCWPGQCHRVPCAGPLCGQGTGSPPSRVPRGQPGPRGLSLTGLSRGTGLVAAWGHPAVTACPRASCAMSAVVCVFQMGKSGYGWVK